MKKILLSLVALFATVSLVSALTYNVTVPAGTNECYIAGEFNGWSHEKMTKVTETTYTITIDDATETSKYKYCSGPSWAFVEQTAGGGDVTDRTYVPEGDIVEKWAAVYDPNAVGSGDIVIKAKKPASWSAMSIHFWGDASSSWPGEAMTQEGDWYVKTFSSVTAISIIFTDGVNPGTRQTENINALTASTCYEVSDDGTTVSYQVVTCPVTGIQSTFDAAVVAANGTISADADFSIINLAGVDVTAQNGSLAAGAYIVKLANGAAQVVTLK